MQGYWLSGKSQQVHEGKLTRFHSPCRCCTVMRLGPIQASRPKLLPCSLPQEFYQTVFKSAANTQMQSASSRHDA